MLAKHTSMHAYYHVPLFTNLYELPFRQPQIAQLRRGSAMFIAERTGRTDIVDMLKKDNASSGFFTDDDSQMKDEFSIPEDGHQ